VAVALCSRQPPSTSYRRRSADADTVSPLDAGQRLDLVSATDEDLAGAGGRVPAGELRRPRRRRRPAAGELPRLRPAAAPTLSGTHKNRLEPGVGLDEEEQSLDRLRRWFRELKAGDIFGVAEGVQAEEQLKHCAEMLDGYAAEVYQAVHAPLGREGGSDA